jgi:hypothetical protein
MEDLTGQSRVTGPAATRAATGDVWYLVYKDETGKAHTVKGGTDAIRKALGEGLLGDASTIVVGRSKSGQFQPVHTVAEFRDLIVAPAALSGNGQSGKPSGVYSKISGAHRKPVEAAAVDFDAAPSGVRGGPTSGRYAQHSGVRAPSPQQVVVQTPFQPDDPQAETTHHSPSNKTPAPVKRPQLPVKKPAESKPKPSFDWTPVIMVGVALASAAVGYLLLTR